MLITRGLSALLLGTAAVANAAPFISSDVARALLLRPQSRDLDIYNASALAAYVDTYKRVHVLHARIPAQQVRRDANIPRARFGDSEGWQELQARQDECPASSRDVCGGEGGLECPSCTSCCPDGLGGFQCCEKGFQCCIDANGVGSCCPSSGGVCGAAGCALLPVRSEATTTVFVTATIVRTVTAAVASQTEVVISTVSQTLTFNNPALGTQTSTVTITQAQRRLRIRASSAPETAFEGVPSAPYLLTVALPTVTLFTASAYDALESQLAHLGVKVKRQSDEVLTVTETATTTIEITTTVTVTATTTFTTTIFHTVFVTVTVAPSATATVTVTTTITTPPGGGATTIPGGDQPTTVPAGTEPPPTGTPPPGGVPPPPPPAETPGPPTPPNGPPGTDILPPPGTDVPSGSAVPPVVLPTGTNTEVSPTNPGTEIPPNTSTGATPPGATPTTPTPTGPGGNPSTSRPGGISTTTGAPASMMTNVPGPPTSSSTPNPPPRPFPGAPLSSDQIAGIVLGIIFGIFFLFLAAFLLRRWTKRRQRVRLARDHQSMTTVPIVPGVGPNTAAGGVVGPSDTSSGEPHEGEVRIVIRPAPKRRTQSSGLFPLGRGVSGDYANSAWPRPPGYYGRTYSFFVEESGDTTPQDPNQWSVASEFGSTSNRSGVNRSNSRGGGNNGFNNRGNGGGSGTQGGGSQYLDVGRAMGPWHAI